MDLNCFLLLPSNVFVTWHFELSHLNGTLYSGVEMIESLADPTSQGVSEKLLIEQRKSERIALAASGPDRLCKARDRLLRNALEETRNYVQSSLLGRTERRDRHLKVKVPSRGMIKCATRAHHAPNFLCFH
jgi:hypothetical protein